MFKTFIDKIAGAGLQYTEVKPADVSKITDMVKNKILTDIAVIASLFIAFGRMFQEFTIDAAKTCINVDIPYAKTIRNKLKLVSKAVNRPWNIILDFHKETGENGPVKLVYDDDGEGWRQEHSGKSRYYINDEFHKLEVAALKIVGQLMEQLVQVRPEFSGTLIAYVSKLKQENTLFGAMCAEARFVKDNGYAAIRDAQEQELSYVRKEYKDDPDELEEQEKAVKAKYREYFLLLGNKLRAAFISLGKSAGNADVSRKWMALACLDASLRNDKGEIVPDQADMSTFADVVLGEEFASLMMELIQKRGETVLDYAEEQLSVCTFEEGEYAEFVLGEAIELDDDGNIVKHAVTKSACRLDGKFLIAKNNKGSWVARKSVFDALEMPSIDSTRDIIITAPVEKGQLHTDKLIKASENAEISFVQYRKINGEAVREAVVCNGTVYGKYRSHKYLGKDATVRKAFDNIGSNVSGSLVECIPMEYEMKDERGYKHIMEYAILVVENIHTTKGWVAINNIEKSPEINESVEEEALDLISGDDW